MQKKQFKAESKRLLDLMINSIYTHKEIFLRELISNASDAIDKMYYRALTDSSINFNKDDYYIRLDADKEGRTLTITDTGIGMTPQELEDNLGTIAKSGSLDFKTNQEMTDDHSIIGQFGVGFYSAFMVADSVRVVSRAHGADKAYMWESDGADGYTIKEAEYDALHGTAITLNIKPDTDDEKYSEFLEGYRLRSLVKKYSDFIRYPIKMEMEQSRKKEGTEDEYETYTELQTFNSMVPLWRKNRSELTEEDYHKFYNDKHYGFDKPARYVHMNAEGTVSFRALLYIPSSAPYDFYTKEYQKGLELYSSNVLIMNKCADLLPDYFGFVQGLVDSESLSLNISRELLQHDRQLKVIAGRIKDKIKSELESMIADDRDNYVKFFEGFGRALKYGVYSDFGAHNDTLKDLLMFYSSADKKLTTLKEYVSRMKPEQKYIYYAAGDNMDRLSRLPQAETALDKGYEILYLTDQVDEFAVKTLNKYDDKEFKSVSDSGDIGLNNDDKKKKENKKDKEIFAAIKDALGGKVKEVVASTKLKSHPVCLSSQGALSIEMEKVLKSMPNAGDVAAEKVLEVNTSHDVYKSLQSAYDTDKDKFTLYANLLYSQALLIEGLPVNDPVELSNDICKLMV